MFILKILKFLFTGICKFVYNIFDKLPTIPEVDVALDTLDLFTSVGLALNYFLPMKVIGQIVFSIVGFYALKVLLTILRSEWGKRLFEALIGKLNGVVGTILSFLSTLGK